jgi:hypothetical protein
MSCSSFAEFVNRGGWTPRKGVVSPLEARTKKEVAEGAGARRKECARSKEAARGDVE